MRSTIVAALAACALATSVGAQMDTVKPVRDTAKVTQSANGDVALPRVPLIRLEIVDDSTGEELSGVEVRDTLSGITATTTADAKLVDLYSLVSASPFSPFAVISVRKPGYAPQTFAINLAKDTYDRTVTLMRNPLGSARDTVKLSGMMVTAKKVTYSTSGFESRMRTASYGRFVPPDSLRKYDNKTLDEVFAAFRVFPPIRARTLKCKTLYYVDGIPYSGPLPKFVSEFEAIEYYPDGNYAPVQFRPTDQGDICAVYVFWMRGYK